MESHLRMRRSEQAPGASLELREPARSDPAVAVLVARWPKLSETFVLDEILELERRGRAPHVIALKPGSDAFRHTKLLSLRAPVFFITARRRPLQAFAATLSFFLRRPRRFLRALSCAWCFGESVARLLQAGLVARYVERSGIHLLYAHFTAPAEVACLASELTGLPFCFRIHGAGAASWMPAGFARLVERACCVLTVSDYTRGVIEALLRGAYSSRLRLAYNPFPREFVARERSSRMTGPLRIVAVARLSPNKGLCFLVAACRRLRGRGLAFLCSIVGEGEERSTLERQIREDGLEGSVVLAGALPQEQVAQRLREADVFVLPCIDRQREWHETDDLPRALVEAMGMGLCVISTPVGGIPEMIQDGVSGLLAPQGDAVALADAIARVSIDAALRRRLARAARKRVQRLCDVRRQMDSLEDVLFKACLRPPA